MTSTSSLNEPSQRAVVVQSDSVRRIHVLVLVVVWAISAGYMATHLKRGWVPHDEGTLGLSAERVLDGELPHRDFDDYTGGLTFVHALAFRVFEINSATMRMVLFAFFLPWVPAVYYVASRFGSAYSAGAATLLAVAWSVPNYPAPMPSWYNLFFATFGVVALLRYLEVGTRRWLLMAGLCGGLSFLAKVTAAYFVAGTLLFFVFCEQSISNERNRQSPARARLYSATVVLALAVFLVLLFRMIHKVPGVGGLIFFVLPAFGLVVLLLAREFAGIGGQNRERFTALMDMCLPFALGFAIPLIAFSTPYVLAGSVRDLVRGLIAVPLRAIRSEVLVPANPLAMFAIIPFALFILVAFGSRNLGRAICASFVALYGCGVLILGGRSSSIYYLGWYSLATAAPVLVLAGVAILWGARSRQSLSLVRQQQIMLMMCVAALCSVVQFPFAMPIYFCYVAPLVILFALALFTSAARPPRLVLGTVLAFYLLFAIVRISPYRMGNQIVPDAPIERLTMARAGGLWVESNEAHLYEELITLVQSHSTGKFIYAAPDCPEVYFLSGSKSPTRHYFDAAEDPVGHTERILRALDELNVKVIAINRNPRFSGPISPDLQFVLEESYLRSAEVGRFEVRWKE